MKLKIGNKLTTIREDRKLNQTEMAELLGISTSTYARIERNETSPDLDQIVSFSKELQIPIQEFLPETFSIHNNQPYGQGGLVFGNIYNYNNKDEQMLAMESANAMLQKEIAFLKDKIELLERQNGLLEALIKK